MNNLLKYFLSAVTVSSVCENSTPVRSKGTYFWVHIGIVSTHAAQPGPTRHTGTLHSFKVMTSILAPGDLMFVILLDEAQHGIYTYFFHKCW